MQTLMLENRETKILRNRMFAAALTAIAFIALLAHAKQLYFGTSEQTRTCCESIRPTRPAQSTPETAKTVEFNLSEPYQLTPQELSQVTPIPPDEWIFNSHSDSQSAGLTSAAH